MAHRQHLSVIRDYFNLLCDGYLRIIRQIFEFLWCHRAHTTCLEKSLVQEIMSEPTYMLEEREDIEGKTTGSGLGLKLEQVSCIKVIGGTTGFALHRFIVNVHMCKFLSFGIAYG